MTYEEAVEALKKIQDRLDKQQWLVDIIHEIPQMDRKKAIAEVNERLIRYKLYGWDAEIEKYKKSKIAIPLTRKEGEVNDEKGS